MSLPETNFLKVMNWVTLFFWTADIIASFFVGYVKKGVTVMQPKMIAKHYMRTWFTIDIIIVAADWTYNMAQASNVGFGDVGRFVRVMRSVRTLRLVRLLKLKRILTDIQDHVDSEYLAILGDVVKLILLMLFLSHLIACVWYFIGKQGKQGRGDNWIE